jgi:hypothetical protein
MRQLKCLPDFNFEKRVIRVIVTPPEVFPLLGIFRFLERMIVPVLLPQINAVSPIFLVVPRMIIAGIPIVVPFVMMIVGPHRHRGNQGGTYKNCGQNQKTTHVLTLLLEQEARH